MSAVFPARVDDGAFRVLPCDKWPSMYTAYLEVALVICLGSVLDRLHSEDEHVKDIWIVLVEHGDWSPFDYSIWNANDWCIARVVGSTISTIATISTVTATGRVNNGWIWVCRVGVGSIRISRVRVGSVGISWVRVGDIRISWMRVRGIRISWIRVRNVMIGTVRVRSVRIGIVRVGIVRVGIVRVGVIWVGIVLI